MFYDDITTAMQTILLDLLNIYVHEMDGYSSFSSFKLHFRTR